LGATDDPINGWLELTPGIYGAYIGWDIDFIGARHLDTD
jgi:hypothetical protein